MPVQVDVTVRRGVPRGESAPAARELRTLARDAARATFRHRGVADAELSVAFLGDADITELNLRYLERERPTDVIAFPLWEEGETPVGDVYIGLAQAYRQAEALGVAPREEVVRLVVHGTLHVLGYDHPEGEDRTGSEMWRLQEEIVAAVIGT